ncbi:MAG: PDZ domain-containing protein [Elusimicrobia bacterium]|nr:PDZ domain-containing protein [Elusimicrobiota bacterium]
MPGYYRFPALNGETVVFTCEDDLWTVPASGGVARRLTSGSGESTHAALSPDGAWLAFTGREEGEAEVTLMPASGGEPRRLTFLGARSMVRGWTPDGSEVLFSSEARSPFVQPGELFAVRTKDGAVRRLGLGPADDLCFGPGGERVLGRNRRDPAFWKRYRGGTAGELWADLKGKGEFRRLVRTGGNMAWPLWVGERVFFVSDHEGVGNLYSVLPSGRGLKRHTAHKDFYVRNPSSDGKRIAYQHGASLRVYDPGRGTDAELPVETASPRPQRARRFVSAARYVEDWELHPQGHSLALVFRGKLSTMGNWEGPALQHGERDAARYRLPRWLGDGKRAVVVSDAGGEEALEVVTVSPAGQTPPRRLAGLDIGRATTLAVDPKADRVLLTNHRNELLCVDLSSGALTKVDRSAFASIRGAAWSPDGRWAAYGFHVSANLSIIRLWDSREGKTYDATRPVLRDGMPAWDPGGKYLYFLSHRDFDPVYDGIQFDLNFPRGSRPHLLTLQKDLASPFVPAPKPLKKGADDAKAAKGKKEDKKDEKKDVAIDLGGLTERVVAFPLPEGRYLRVMGLPGKVLFTAVPVSGSLDRDFFSSEPTAKATLKSYEFENKETKTVAERVSDFDLSRDNAALGIQAGRSVRVIAAGETVDAAKDAEGYGRKSGLVDLSRAKASLDPAAEWRQMYADAWRLQRDLFWNPGLKALDWKAVYRRYEPLLERVASRSEFTDILWEMQGELGTSHAYAIGGDYRAAPRYAQGFLGAEWDWDAVKKAWRLSKVLEGDCWDRDADSALRAPGVNVAAGDLLLAVDGWPLDSSFSPAQALVHKARAEVQLRVSRDGGEPRTVTVTTLFDEQPVRYRAWVERNRRIVHAATRGRVGYIHVPDMGPAGYAEFHRAYLAEVERDGLIVDVRNNGGGHVSALLLEKLARRRIGYGASRWAGVESYPQDAPAGPMVALTDEWAGSDGDIFSHAFKRLGLGPLIGKRTWGGVIGIHPRFPLADGGLTTQPEYAFWFDDVGWGVENYGTDPDIEVDFRPQDHAAGKDPQLERGLVEVRRLVAKFKAKRPELKMPRGNGPRLDA